MQNNKYKGNDFILFYFIEEKTWAHKQLGAQDRDRQ
jgi:hypothetical protein